MFKDLLINTVTIVSRDATTTYADGIAKKDYTEVATPIKCRVSSLSYKDLQLLSDTDDVAVKVQKLYTMPNIDIKTTDYVVFDSKRYQVISMYKAQDAKGVFYNKYFIKLVD